MKFFYSKLLPILLVVVLSACTNDEDGIYINDIKSEIISYTEMELEIIDLINQHRQTLNLSQLKPLSIVSVVAEEHTAYMIQKGQVSHDNFGIRQQKLVEAANAKTVGENLAYGYSSAKSVVNAWLASEAHRKNIEKPNYTDIGISSEANIEGRFFYTQLFIER